jgi:hypothetical protein
MRSQRRRLERLAAAQAPVLAALLAARRDELLRRVRALLVVDAGLQVLGIDPATVRRMRLLPETLAELDTLPPETADEPRACDDDSDPAAAARAQERLERLEGGFRGGAQPDFAGASLLELFAFVRARVPPAAIHERLAELRAEVEALGLQGTEPRGETPGADAAGADAAGADAPAAAP